MNRSTGKNRLLTTREGCSATVLYHKSHLYDLPSVSQITHVQSPMSAVKSEHSIFSPEIVIGPGDLCSNTHPQPFPPNLPAEQSWQRWGGRNIAAGGHGDANPARSSCVHRGSRTWSCKHPPGISHSTQPSLQAYSRQRQTLLLRAWGQFCPQPDVCWRAVQPGCAEGAQSSTRTLAACTAHPGQEGRLRLCVGSSFHTTCTAQTCHVTPA